MNFFLICSVIILVIGIVFLIVCGVKNEVSLIYLPSLFFIEIMGEFFLENNLVLLSLTALINFLFLSYFFSDHISILYRRSIIYFSIGSYILIVIFNFQFVMGFTNEIRLFFDFLILLLISYVLVKLVLVEKNIKIRSVIMPFIVLLFFSLDFFLAIPFEFMTNQSLELVAVFWFIRVLVLQVYYASIIYSTWKGYRIQ